MAWIVLALRRPSVSGRRHPAHEQLLQNWMTMDHVAHCNPCRYSVIARPYQDQTITATVYRGYFRVLLLNVDESREAALASATKPGWYPKASKWLNDFVVEDGVQVVGKVCTI